LTAAGVGPGLVEFLAICEVLLQICLASLFTSWKPWLTPLKRCSLHWFVLPAHSSQDSLQFI
jgi:hypothetical protein